MRVTVAQIAKLENDGPSVSVLRFLALTQCLGLTFGPDGTKLPASVEALLSTPSFVEFCDYLARMAARPRRRTVEALLKFLREEFGVLA